MNPISTSNAEHYIWGNDCDGWLLLKRDDMSIIQERVPPGRAEVMHYHQKSHQFFYILEGEGQMALKDEVIDLQKGQGIEIPAMIAHRSNTDVIFLVISMPKSHGDRMIVE